VSDVVVREIPVADTRPLRHAILRPTEPLEQLVAHEHERTFAVGAFEQEQLLAVGQIAPDARSPSGLVDLDARPPSGHLAGEWRVRGMATAEHARSRGLGAAVLDALVLHAIAEGATRVWCNARTPARSFYERAHFRVVSEEFQIAGIGPHFVMERAVGGARADPALRTPISPS
jgi:GNAT superfamily N-acetyltransferase